jgi:hypothetical protein
MKSDFEKADVEVNPSYGEWNGSTLDAGTGSLSVRVTTPRSTPSDDEQCG